MENLQYSYFGGEEKNIESGGRPPSRLRTPHSFDFAALWM